MSVKPLGSPGVRLQRVEVQGTPGSLNAVCELVLHRSIHTALILLVEDTVGDEGIPIVTSEL